VQGLSVKKTAFKKENAQLTPIIQIKVSLLA